MDPFFTWEMRKFSFPAQSQLHGGPCLRYDQWKVGSNNVDYVLPETIPATSPETLQAFPLLFPAHQMRSQEKSPRAKGQPNGTRLGP